MKILHLTPENFAGLPATIVKAERALGHESYLLTMYRNPRGLTGEDYCLDLPYIANSVTNTLRRLISSDSSTLSNKRRNMADGVPVWQPKRASTRLLYKLRDNRWETKIRRFLERIAIKSFDIIVLDSGLGFLRSGRIVKELSAAGKKIVTCYYGSDLRTRGVIPEIEKLASARFSFEFDHTLLYPELTFLFFPFELPKQPVMVKEHSIKVRIGHAPTNRAAKGTPEILHILNRLQRDYQIEIVLIENLPYLEALALKSSCDIFVDTIGELGYGINSLEALAMGIPTAVQLLSDFEVILGDHPFINVSAETLADRLVPFIESRHERQCLGQEGPLWLDKMHRPEHVAEKMLRIISNAML